ncbi:hypothetical protein ASPBRDRAFT_435910 [Aspergillus brasiliensis CBS 101740]|uniref:Uncharacterized protein n=1 Tax=Aspergillus brasiliensis (strain CBS 101740 / IMI 381727 / IBT 21946) TaxID=767769 RepID=A0A1L9U2R4_ASPBC|nr:hypothetical protein ASPBRDRAFT_435910 [Aspergillus brasiliensis CBS 101740]
MEIRSGLKYCDLPGTGTIHPANETMPTGHVKERWSNLLTVGRTDWTLPIGELADLPVYFNELLLLSTFRRGHSACGVCRTGLPPASETQCIIIRIGWPPIVVISTSQRISLALVLLRALSHRIQFPLAGLASPSRLGTTA